MNQKIEGSLSVLVRPVPLTASRSLSGACAECAQSIAPARASDSLRLTGEAAGLQALQRELAAAPAIDAAKVDAVREALALGRYQINPDTIAARMLELDEQLGA